MKRKLFRVLWGLVALIAAGAMVYGLDLMMTHIKPGPGWPAMATWGVGLFISGLAGSIIAAKWSDDYR